MHVSEILLAIPAQGLQIPAGTAGFFGFATALCIYGWQTASKNAPLDPDEVAIIEEMSSRRKMEREKNLRGLCGYPPHDCPNHPDWPPAKG